MIFLSFSIETVTDTLLAAEPIVTCAMSPMWYDDLSVEIVKS